MTAGKRIAETPLDVAASKGGHALMAWLDAVPVAYRPAGDPQLADHLADVLAEQVEAIRQAKDEQE